MSSDLDEIHGTSSISPDRTQPLVSTSSPNLLEEALKIANVRSYQGQFENGIAHGIATI